MWIARNKTDKHNVVFRNKPKRLEWSGIWYDNSCGRIPNAYGLDIKVGDFPLMKWEDEPIEVGIVPKKYIDLFIEANEKEYEEYKKEVIQTDYQIKAEGIYG